MKNRTPNCGVNCTAGKICGSTSSDSPRSQEIQAFLRHEAIVLAEGAAAYDLVVPVYCAPLDEAHQPAACSYIAIEVKARKHATTVHLPRLQMPGLAPKSSLLLVWLQMRVTLGQRHGPHVRLSHHSSHHGKTCWRFVCNSHHYRDHTSLEAALGRYGAAKFSILPPPGQTHADDAQPTLNDLLRDNWAESVDQAVDEELPPI